MIPIGAPSIWQLLLVLLLPCLAVFGTLGLLLYWLIKRPLRWGSWKLRTLLLLVLAADLWMGWLVLHVMYFAPLEFSRIEARRQFTLTQSHRHGELVFAAGTQIYRVDNFDSGSRHYRQTLTESFVAEFPQPLEMAGVWASAVDMYISIYPKVRLAKPYLAGGEACGVGQVAVFDNLANSRDYLRDAWGRVLPMPEGKEAWFVPSQWKFIECQSPEKGDFHLGSRALLH